MEEGSLVQAALGREALVLEIADRTFPMATSAKVNRKECRQEVSEVNRMTVTPLDITRRFNQRPKERRSDQVGILTKVSNLWATDFHLCNHRMRKTVGPD